MSETAMEKCWRENAEALADVINEKNELIERYRTTLEEIAEKAYGVEDGWAGEMAREALHR